MATGLQFISKDTITSSVASLSITDKFTTACDIYMLNFSGFQGVSSSGSVKIQFIDNGGSAITSTDYYYANLLVDSTTTFTETRSGTSDDIEYVPQYSTSFDGASGIMYVFNPVSTSAYTFVTFQGAGSFSTAFRGQKAIGLLHTVDSITGIKLNFSSSNVDSGQVSIYGVK